MYMYLVWINRASFTVPVTASVQGKLSPVFRLLESTPYYRRSSEEAVRITLAMERQLRSVALQRILSEVGHGENLEIVQFMYRK